MWTVTLVLVMIGMGLVRSADTPAAPLTVAGQPTESNPPMDGAALEDLLAPVALYPDDLLAIVLPASTYPLQIVQAARFLEARKADPKLQPEDEWDDSIVALLNYPEALALLNNDLDWTWRLGEAVLNQQPDVVKAVERFRQRAHTAGNLESDERKVVSHDNGAIEIASSDDSATYIPYYEPAQVIYPQSVSTYHYYPRSYPVYYYPYGAGKPHYSSGFWGVTTAFTIGWLTNRLHVHHHGYRSHPYFGIRYQRPYYRLHRSHSPRHYRGTGRRHHRDYHGDYWRAGRRHGHRPQNTPGHHRADTTAKGHGRAGAIRRGTTSNLSALSGRGAATLTKRPRRRATAQTNPGAFAPARGAARNGPRRDATTRPEVATRKRPASRPNAGVTAKSRAAAQKKHTSAQPLTTQQLQSVMAQRVKAARRSAANRGASKRAQTTARDTPPATAAKPKSPARANPMGVALAARRFNRSVEAGRTATISRSAARLVRRSGRNSDTARPSRRGNDAAITQLTRSPRSRSAQPAIRSERASGTRAKRSAKRHTRASGSSRRRR